MSAKIVNSFEKLFVKYKDVLSIKELTELSKQLDKYGYYVEIAHSDGNPQPKPEEASGLIENIKRFSAIKNNIDLELTPAQAYMYR